MRLNAASTLRYGSRVEHACDPSEEVEGGDRRALCGALVAQLDRPFIPSYPDSCRKMSAHRNSGGNPMTDRAIRIEKIRAGELLPGDVFRWPSRTSARDGTWLRVQEVRQLRGDRVSITPVRGNPSGTWALDLVEVQVRQEERPEPEPRVPDGGPESVGPDSDPVYRESMMDAGRGHLLS